MPAPACTKPLPLRLAGLATHGEGRGLEGHTGEVPLPPSRHTLRAGDPKKCSAVTIDVEADASRFRPKSTADLRACIAVGRLGPRGEKEFASKNERGPTEAALPTVPFSLIGKLVPAFGNLKKGFLGGLVPSGLSHGFGLSGFAAIFVGSGRHAVTISRGLKSCHKPMAVH
jgi:hypothetical protein